VGRTAKPEDKEIIGTANIKLSQYSSLVNTNGLDYALSVLAGDSSLSEDEKVSIEKELK